MREEENKDPFMWEKGRRWVKCKKVCHVGTAYQQGTPMWFVWTCGAPLILL
jgi:hypothetical protein